MSKLHIAGACRECTVKYPIRDAGAVVCLCPLHRATGELLEACKYVVRYHREHDSGEGELFGLDFVTTCISAIHKAEGR